MTSSPKNLIDADIKKILDWLLKFLSHEDWHQRKENIEKYLEILNKPGNIEMGLDSTRSLSFDNDKMGWYLYLAEVALTEIYKYEPTQGSRILPIFKRMGEDFDSLMKIRGLEDKVNNLINSHPSQADSGLFEILVALLWVKNGWPEVEFIHENSTERRPDIRAKSKKEQWLIECKRLAKSSAYSIRERENWLRMWKHLGKYLAEHRLPYVLDITFHVELKNLPDEFMIDELSGKLALISPPCTVVANEVWEVSIKLVDFNRARSHLLKQYVKIPSDQLRQLVGGSQNPEKGFTHGIIGNQVRIGKGRGNNFFLDTMDFACGAFWSCDAIRAIQQKARDIRGHLADAITQFPYREKAVVHIGVETLDGWLVERERYDRILETVYSFDTFGKDLRWIYCHLFQSYAPPEEAWIIDETVYSIPKPGFFSDEPVKHRFTIGLKNEDSETGVHWLRKGPKTVLTQNKWSF